MSRNAQTEKLLYESGLRVRLFVYNRGKEVHSKSINKHFLYDISLDVDFFNESPEEIIDQLYNSKFMGYASIIIIISRKLASPGCKKILKAMKSNRHLRFKSKLLLMLYDIDGVDDSEYVVLNNYFDYLEIDNVDGFLYPNYFPSKKPKIINEDLNRFYAARDYEDFEDFKLDNCILVQIFFPKGINKARVIDEFFMTVFWEPFDAIQKLLLKSIPFDLRIRIVKASTNSNLYFYAINPALAIIINNYYFTSPGLAVREGSDRDAAHLVRILKLSGIPYILVEDCNLEELKQTFTYMATKDFNPIKSLFLFLMSHGDEKNVFYTNDGELNIYSDIVERIQSNPSLKDVQKFFIVNAGRGSTDLEYDMDDVVESLNQEAMSREKYPNLMDNTMVLHGVPEGVQSPRSHLWGSPLIQSLCQHFTDIKTTDDVRELNIQINNDLSQLEYFEGLKQCSDLILSDASKSCPILEVPTKFLEMLKLINSIAKEFPGNKTTECNKMLSRFLYVCGVLNYGKFPSIDDIKNKYFSPELEYENSDVEDLPKHLFGENI